MIYCIGSDVYGALLTDTCKGHFDHKYFFNFEVILNLVTYLRVIATKSMYIKEYKKYVHYFHVNSKLSKWYPKRRSVLIKYKFVHVPDGVATQNG